jgi:ATP-binding cassette subfamily F protein 3
VVDWPGTYEEYLSVAGDGSAPGLSHLADFDALRRKTESAAPKGKSESVKAPPAKSSEKPAARIAEPAKPIDRDAQKEERRKRKRLDELEARIEALDASLKALDERLAIPGFFDDYEVSSKALAEREKLAREQESAWAEVGALEA